MKRIWNYISARGTRVISTQDMLKTTSVLVGLFHVAMLIFFSSFGIHQMVAVNIISIVIYACCYAESKRGENLKIIFDVIYTEILVFSIVSTLIMGIDSGFMLYLIAIIPLGYYAVYYYKDIGISINPIVYVIATVVGFWGTRIVCRFIEPRYSYGSIIIDRAMYMVNYMVIVVAVVVFCSIVITKVVVLEEKQRLQNIALETLAKFDPLTGLTNRRAVQEQYEKSKANGEGYTVILGDIDDFKKLNDTYGHDIGDEALKAVANAFKVVVQNKGLVCRWGGEEILVFIPNVSKEYTTKMAEDILNNIRMIEIYSQEEVINTTMTLGVAVSTEAEGLHHVIKKADERLYEGKRMGKNRVVD